MIIDLPRFIAQRQPQWKELESRLSYLEENSAVGMSLKELKHFHLLFQQTAGDLAKIQTFAAEPELCRYLESLVAQAYAEIHETRRHTRADFHPLRWFWMSFPAVFGRHIRAFRLSLAILIMGAIFGGGVVLVDPGSKEALLPFSHLLGSPSQRVAKEEAAKKDHMAGVKATFASELMANNIRVSIFAFALGMTLGLGTVITLFYNGVILGAVIADYIAAGQTVFLVGWLLPHGSVEIPSILIAGQAGLLLGSALIGQGSRAPLAVRLRSLAPSLITLIGGVAVLLVWAGIIESFVSQYHEPVLPYWAKIAFGSVQLVLLFAFLGGYLPGQKSTHPLHE